jgi:hypothetical protein
MPPSEDAMADLALYSPPAEHLPYLAVVFEDQEMVACEAVMTKEEGVALLRLVEEHLDQFLAFAPTKRN